MIGLKAMFALALATVGAATPWSGTTIRRKLEAGAKDSYEVKCVLVRIPAEGLPGDPNTTKVTWNADYSIEKVDPAKGAGLKVEITDWDMASEDGKMHSNRPKNSTITATIDERNRLTAPSSDKALVHPTLMWLPVDALELPEKEISAGDSWDVTLADHFLLGKAPVVSAKLSGEETYGGHPAWVVTVEKKGITSDSRVQLKTGGDTKDATVKGKFDLSMKIWVDKETGKTLSATSKIKGTQRLVMEEFGDQPPTGIEFTSTLKLKAPKA